MKDIKNETNVDHTLEMSNDDDLINLYPTLLYVRDIIILVHECMRSLTSILFHVTTLIRDEAAFEPHHWNMTLIPSLLHPIDVENYDASPNIILISSDDENDDEDEAEKDVVASYRIEL
ncbi:hypothetical protein Tco_1057135 [Tanacetum coccineum]|uniref:Uncharacterized protein n=1 Tax=Tanacetum coccineum TaxID=301880 RepID=A0ABQ5H6L0_9ASTR